MLALLGRRASGAQASVSPRCDGLPISSGIGKVLSRRITHRPHQRHCPPVVASLPLGRGPEGSVMQVAGEPQGCFSRDLQEMCTLQLSLLHQLLSKSTTPAAGAFRRLSITTTVYVRSTEVAPPGAVLLQKVATFPSTGTHVDTDRVVLHMGPGLAGGRSAAASGAADSGGPHNSMGSIGLGSIQECMGPALEECLVSEEMLVLPSSGALVMPLAEGSFLVGLLVVEPETHTGGAAAAAASTGLLAGQPAVGKAGGVTLGHSSGSWGLPVQGMLPGSVVQPATTPPVPVALGRQGVTVGGQGMAAPPKSGPAVAPVVDGHFSTPDPSGSPAWHVLSSHVAFTEDELSVLRLSAPILAKACAMELRSNVRGAQAAAAAAMARNLVREAQRPVATINTFSAMLLPRTEEGDPERDMARGIAMQGKRLADLLRHLDAALATRNPATNMQQLAAAAGAAPQGTQPVLDRMRPPTPLPASRPEPPPAALPSQPSQQLHPLSAPSINQASQKAEGQGPEAPVEPSSRVASESPAYTAVPAGGAVAQVPASQPQVVGVQKPAHAADVASVAAAASALRQAAAERKQQAARRLASQSATSDQADSSGSTGSSAHVPVETVVPDAGPRTFQMRLAADAMTDDGVIELEADGDVASWSAAASQGAVPPLRKPTTARGTTHSPRPVTSPAAPAAATTSKARSARVRADGAPPVSSTSPPAARIIPPSATGTNMAQVLLNVLTAAARLAKATNIKFICHPPLALATEASRGSSSSSSSSDSRDRGTSISSMGWDQPGEGSVDGPVSAAITEGTVASNSLAGLKPRPVRPMLVAVRPAVVRQIAAFVVDLALQCTPPGGTLSVSVQTQGPQHVMLLVTHTGQMVVERYHPVSRTLHTPSTQPPTSVAATGSAHMVMQALRSGAAAVGAAPGHSNRTTGELAVSPTSGGRVVSASVTAAPPASAARAPVPGSGLLSFQMAEELVVAAGGTITCTYPVQLINPITGLPDSATSVAIMLPAAPPRVGSRGSGSSKSSSSNAAAPRARSPEYAVTQA